MLESGHHHYVVTEDLYPIMRNWAEKRGFVIPDVRWFAYNHHLLRVELENTLNQDKEDKVTIVDSLPYHYVTGHLKSTVHVIESREEFRVDLGSVVSLDQVYSMEFDHLFCSNLEVNRVVDIEGKDLGNSVRPNTPSLEEQIENFKRAITSRSVIVIDDGIWTGHTMRWAVNALQNQGLNVVAVVVGIRHKEPGNVPDLGVPESRIYETQLYLSYERPILDWVCERDYFPGVPFGGRTVIDKNLYGKLEYPTSIGAYYIDRPEWLKSWASIEDSTETFRAFCYQRSLALFEEIERSSGKEVLVRDLPRISLRMVLNGAQMHDRFCDLLEAEISS